MHTIRPKVSVIIPVYNVEKYVRECLESVINQTLKEIEIICINDKSTDRSLDILNQYAAIDNRLQIINNRENEGLSFTRNRGIKVAKGEYIYFLDSDDMIVPEAMDQLYSIAENENLDVILFDTKQIFENKNLKRMRLLYKGYRQQEYCGFFTGIELFQMLVKNEEYDVVCWRQFWKYSYIFDKKLFFYEGILHEDILFSFSALIGVTKSACLNKKYHVYRRRENAITTKELSWENLEGFFTCYCEILFLWKKESYKHEINLVIEQYIDSLYMSIQNLYNKIKNIERVEIFNNHSPIIQYMFKQFLASMEKKEICKTIEKNKLKIIKNFKEIIIYGAGIVGHDVLHILDQNQIGIYGFAVSEKKESISYVMGHKVYPIKELKELSETSIVLVAVTEKYQKSIIKKLNKLEFKHIICVC